MSRMLDAALKLAARGWLLFPVATDKRPLVAHGFRDATDDLRQIRRWWSEHPDAGIGWAIPADIVVLDIDARHRGHESLDALERQHGRLPPTLTQITGGGGLHYFYNAPCGVEIRQVAGLRDGIDTRVGGRGYVVIPPSVHQSGLAYAWSRRMRPVEIPAWLAELVRVPDARPYTPAANGEISDRYALAALRGEAKQVAATGEGARNARLFRAWKRCSVDLGSVLPRAVVLNELTAAAIASGLAPQEIERVLR